MQVYFIFTEKLKRQNIIDRIRIYACFKTSAIVYSSYNAVTGLSVFVNYFLNDSSYFLTA